MNTIDSEKSDPAFCYSVQNPGDWEKIEKIGKALSTRDRIRILQMLSCHPMNLYELSVSLAIPFSSVHKHINVLTASGLIFIDYKPTNKRHEKICVKSTLSAVINFEDTVQNSPLSDTVEMPIGLYRDCEIHPPCGILSAEGRLGTFDNPTSFYQPDAAKAELLWFNHGYVTYHFPRPKSENPISELSFSFELCSETMYYNNDWKSDITVEINDIECVTIHSPGDYGGRRGNYSPDFWGLSNTQFGSLWTVTAKKDGIFLNSARISAELTIDDLQLQNRPFVKLKIGIKEDARHVGGLNLFGKNFGDYQQAIIMKTISTPPPRKFCNF